MIIHGIGPGPQVMQKQSELVWDMIPSMWVDNLMAADHQPAGDLMQMLPVLICVVHRQLVRDRHLLGEPRAERCDHRRRVRAARLIKHDFESAPLLLGSSDR